MPVLSASLLPHTLFSRNSLMAGPLRSSYTPCDARSLTVSKQALTCVLALHLPVFTRGGWGRTRAPTQGGQGSQAACRGLHEGRRDEPSEHFRRRCVAGRAESEKGTCAHSYAPRRSDNHRSKRPFTREVSRIKTHLDFRSMRNVGFT